MRRWICILALFGVLAHATALVRHNANALAMAMVTASNADLALAGHDGAELAADLQMLCSAAQAGGDRAGLPPSAPRHDCPVCMGLASAFALPAVDIVIARPPVPAFISHFDGEDQRVTVQRRLRPPSRAPPIPA